MKFALDEFHAAVYELAADDSDMKTRLAAACMNHIGFLGPARDELPREIQNDFDSLHQMMTKNGGIRETINAMNRDEAMKLAGEIVSLSFRFTEEYARQQP